MAPQQFFLKCCTAMLQPDAQLGAALGWLGVTAICGVI